MKISKQDALMWFSFFAALPEDEEIMPRQMEIVYAVFAQLEDAVEVLIGGAKSSPPSRISSRSPDERFTSAATRSFRADAAPVSPDAA